MVKPAKGTTTLAFIFKEGVMVAADSRASMGGYICECLSTLLIGTDKVFMLLASY
jgi:20S proteasome subunit beta 5